jgi:FHS family glucose/mannose:H+ symporter-like MFS transporter
VAAVGAVRPLMLGVALIAAAISLIAIRVFPSTADRADSAVPHLPLQTRTRFTLFAVLMMLYVGTETALGGWVADHTHRLEGVTTSMRWALAPAAFWTGLTAGRAVVAIWVSRSREDAALIIGLGIGMVSLVGLLVSTNARDVLLVALVCGAGLGPVFPVTVAAVSREFSPPLAAALIALGAVGGATIPWLVGAVSDWTGSLVAGLSTLLGTVTLLMVFHGFRLRFRF